MHYIIWRTAGSIYRDYLELNRLQIANFTKLGIPLPKQPKRLEYCQQLARSNFPFVVAFLYKVELFGDQKTSRINLTPLENMVSSLKLNIIDFFENLPWPNASAKEKLKRNFTKADIKIGYPDEFDFNQTEEKFVLDNLHDDLEINRFEFLTNCLNLKRTAYQNYWKEVIAEQIKVETRRPIWQKEWLNGKQMIDFRPSYVYQNEAFIFYVPLGLLQQPYYYYQTHTDKDNEIFVRNRGTLNFHINICDFNQKFIKWCQNFLDRHP